MKTHDLNLIIKKNCDLLFGVDVKSEKKSNEKDQKCDPRKRRGC
jgi:hypothetical protein